MSPTLKAAFSSPCLNILIHSNHKSIFKLIIENLSTGTGRRKHISASRPTLTVRFFFHKTPYSKIPRSPYDCFHGFTVFYNRFVEYDPQVNVQPRICYDVGPRTLRIMIEPRRSTITSYIATPGDIEKDLLFDLLFYQPLKYLLQAKNICLLHASCAALNGKGVIFSGKSGNGKSTSALALLNNGFDYIADDEVLLRPKGSGIECSFFSSQPKMPFKTLKYFPHLKTLNKSHTLKKDKALIDFDQIFSKQKDGKEPMGRHLLKKKRVYSVAY